MFEEHEAPVHRNRGGHGFVTAGRWRTLQGIVTPGYGKLSGRVQAHRNCRFLGSLRRFKEDLQCLKAVITDADRRLPMYGYLGAPRCCCSEGLALLTAAGPLGSRQLLN